MRIGYFDVTGDREWSSFRDCTPLVAIHRSLSKPDVAFIHVSDLAQNDTADELKDAWARSGRIGDGTADVIFLSGAATITQRKMEDFRNLLSDHDPGRLFFYRRSVPHGMTVAELEKEFGAFLNAHAKTAISASEYFAGRNDTDGAAELSAAFRMLWETYLDAGSPRLYPGGDAKPLPADALQFDKDYWAPVLKDGSMNPLLIELGDDDVRGTAVSLRSHRDWNNIPPDVRADGQRQLERQRARKWRAGS
jgi:hypothetical protein